MSVYHPWYDNFYELSIPRGQPRPLEQYFGMVLTPEEVMAASAQRELPRGILRPRDYQRPWHTFNRKDLRPEGGSIITRDKDKFQISLNVQQFFPNEITVKTVRKQVVVEARHEERQDDHGLVFRHFVRKYNLPKSHKPDDVVSNLSSDGVLTITAPRKPVEGEVPGERVVPIQTTGPSSKKKTEPPVTQTQPAQE